MAALCCWPGHRCGKCAPTAWWLFGSSPTVVQENNLGFLGARYNGVKGEEMEGPNMLEITNTAVTRDEVWHAFRQAHNGRRHERYHGVLLLLDGKSCP